MAVAGSVLGGCAAPHTDLGPRSSTCFKALPAAHAAAHGHGHLLGLRLSSATRVARLVGELTGSGGVDPASLPGPATKPDRPLCVVAFQGDFASGQVTGSAGSASGHFAIVVVNPSGDGPVRSFVVSRLPVRFRHLV
ncbi:MAG: hypothetical protein ACRD0L_13720 [Acidimicrobiales bacterium]